MIPTTSPTTAMTTNAAMIIRRTQRGAPPGAVDPFHMFVKLDQRALSCRRAIGSCPCSFFVMVSPNLSQDGAA
jgi:hypothetical protein